MSYIELINAAWELREQGIISAHEHDLFNYLLHKCNRLNWKNPFNQSTEIICATLGISRSSLVVRRNNLRKHGLITFRKGVTRTKPAQYTLSMLHSAPLASKVLAGKKKELNKPTLKDVSKYCKERKNEVDAQAFYDFYEAKGWMIGRNRIKDWRAAIRTWERKAAGVKLAQSVHNNDKQYEKF